MRGTSLPDGTRLVSSLNIPERRKTAAELKAISIEDRLIAERGLLDLTDAEKQERLEMEDLRHRLEMSDNELSWQDLDRLSDSALGED